MIKTGQELADACRNLASHHKTLYVLGCFGWPMDAAHQNRSIQAYAFNRKAERVEKIRAAQENTFGFDCVNMIKALLWGWCGDTKHTYGGAVYVSNGVPDINANTMIRQCSNVSTDFSKIQVGEVLWINGHIGVYIGDGLAVECTYRWADGVQVTAVHNIGRKDGYQGREWTSHGKLPYICYEESYELTHPVLRMGDRSESVRALQFLLIGRGFDCGSCGADGIFGKDTHEAVILCQRKAGLSENGVVDAKTMYSLMGGEDI